MKIHVKPRYWVEQAFESFPDMLVRYAVISIYSSGDCSPIPENRSTILKLQFDDITKQEAGLILFTDEMADKIIRFADFLIENFPTRRLIVHCDAGVSRSGAVGAFLNDYINTKMGMETDKKEFWKEHRNLILPNGWVKARLMKAWKCKGNK